MNYLPIGLSSYNRWAIVQKTHGVMADDEILRFILPSICGNTYIIQIKRYKQKRQR
ncbi:hypothetical protein [Bacillus dakarensis]|uniref:hypothetical protein n=1 Tax=Robertmurraya dakarensis TaxID=1926278 RepID=UPI00192A19AB|nr:hypothetical protein [Bacillus dakarensis]